MIRLLLLIFLPGLTIGLSAQSPYPRLHTASRNVHILDTSFYMPQLQKERRIWIYLPEGYESSKKKYPVLYMHDGQNLFDEATSFVGEWGVDEALDTLGGLIKQCIVVGIDHGGAERIQEYLPYPHERFGTGKGGDYARFLVNTLKPFIDKNYRTKKNRSCTFLAGSSLGGLMSFYLLLTYPKIFGGAGVFSPSFWIAPQLDDEIKAKGNKVKGKIYFYAGKEEGENEKDKQQMVTGVFRIFDAMRQVSASEMRVAIRVGAKHNEASWRNEFPMFYEWIFRKKKTKTGTGRF